MISIMTKIFIIGPFKVGKSTIVGNLLDKPKNLGDVVENTKGVDVYKTTIDGSNILLFDTEGFYQPIEDNESVIREKFVMELMKNCCQVLIVVLNQMTTNDIQPLSQLIDTFKSNNFLTSMIIVHNLRYYKSEENVDKYLNQVKSIDAFKGEIYNNVLKQNLKNKSIEHIAFGKIDKLKDRFNQSLQHIKGLCRTGSKPASLSDVLILSSLKVLRYYYTIDSDLIFNLQQGKSISGSTIEKDCFIIKKIGDRVIASNDKKINEVIKVFDDKLKVDFQIIKGHEDVVSLFVEGSGIIEESIKINFLSSTSIYLRCDKITYGREPHLRPIEGEIEFPYELVKDRDSRDFSIKEITKLKSGYYMIPFKINSIERVHTMEEESIIDDLPDLIDMKLKIDN
jgi:signal recognition particle receptor subunit beta